MAEAAGDGKLWRTWSFWYLIPDSYKIRSTDWTDFLHRLNTFNTIDEMWATLNAVGRATQLPKGSRFYVFKSGVKPLWEDVANMNGKIISMEHAIAKSKKPNISDRWLDVLLAVLGETFANSGLVNGVEFTVRKETYAICVWLSPCDQEKQAAVEKDLSRIVNWKSQLKVAKIEVTQK